MVFRYS